MLHATTKSLILKLDGDLREGVRVTLSIGFEGISPYKEVTGNLPPFAPLQTIIEEWRTHYHSLGSNNRALTAKKVTYSGSIAQKQESCKHLAIELQRRLNTWLFSKSFRPIRETWLKELHENEAVRVLIRTSNQQLRQIPWHLWDLLEEYPNVELALSATDYQKRTEAKTASIRDKVKILAILGNSTDIDVAADQKLLDSLPDASVTFLVMPQRHEINDSLWEKPWDILFFAGHSQTVGDSGRIYINENKESLTIDDLKYGLKKAISNGLTVAIFNSCDGLGLASSLEALHIPQIIVMREQVPDEVAQVFLKHFLVAFALWGKPLYQAAKEARLKLHGLENKYPCASWLPVICQNGDATPPSWLDLGRRPTDIIPYRGLFAFQEKDAQFFFGRETFTDMLVDAVQKQPLVAVIGSSGSGKSSVVFAGLVRRLRAGNWHIVDFRPGSRPLFNLASSLVSYEESLFGKLLSRTERLREIRNLASDLQHCIHSLRDRIDDFLKSDPDQHFLLIADQFEELYTMSTDAKERLAFLDRLLEATHYCHNFTFVITLRADFLGQALSYRPFADALQYADLKLAPMRSSELFAAIEKPAQLLGVTIETGLAERIIRAVSAEPGDLPLLEFALTQLWTKQHKGQLTHNDYDEIGGVEAALARYADSAYDKLNFEEKERAQRIFIQLVHPGEGTEDTRRVATRAEVGEENWDLVTRLASSRLVVTARDEKTGLDTVEVVHEALIRSWGQLQQWMQQDRDFRCWQELLRVAMRTWDSCGFDEATLLRGKPLADAEYWQSQRFLELSLAERSFIGLSVELRDRELKKHKRRRQLTISGLVGGLVLALILALIAIKQWQKARISEINTFSKSAETLLISNNELDALIPSIKAGRQLKSTFGADANTRMQVVEILWRTLSFVRERNRLQAHDDETTSINFCPHGKLIVSGSADKTIKLWRIDGKLLQTFKGHENRITSVSLSQDGTRIASASDDKTIKLWRIDGKLLQTFKGHENKITSVSLSQDGTRIASAGDDKTIKLWSRDGKLLQTFKGHKDKITSISLSQDGTTIASASDDKTIKLWSRDGKLLQTLKGHEDKITSISLSQDGTTIASASDDKTIKLWSRDGKLLQTLKGHNDGIDNISLSPNATVIVSSSSDGTVKLWSRDGELLQTHKQQTYKVAKIGFSSDRNFIIASNNEEKTIRLWSENGKQLRIIRGHNNAIWNIGFSPDGETIATASADHTVKLWSKGGKLLQTLKGHTGEITNASFSPDGKILVTTSYDNTIKLWSRDGKELKTLRGHHHDVTSVSFNPDGQIFATASFDKTIKIWRIDGKLLQTLKGHRDGIWNISFSPDGQILASVSPDKTVKLWSSNGKLLQTLKGHNEEVTNVAFSPDGKMIASTGADKIVKLWSRDGKELRTLNGHKDEVWGVRFSPDGQILATSDKDKTIKLWSRDGKELGTLKGHSDAVWSVVFSPDGQTLASASRDKSVILWNWKDSLDSDLNRLLGRACDWTRDYLKNNPNVSESDKYLCDGIVPQENK